MSQNPTIPYLSRLEPAAQARVRAEVQLMKYPAGTVLVAADGAMQGFMTVLEGVLRVQHLSPSGRELMLYRLESGQNCVTFLPLMREGEAVAETDVRAALLPLSCFEVLQAESVAFRKLVQEVFASRLSHVMSLASGLAYERVDVRLAHCLLRRAASGTLVCATHEELARELGTAREVVSRVLKHFKRMGWIGLRRGCIDILEPARLSEWGEGGGSGPLGD